MNQQREPSRASLFFLLVPSVYEKVYSDRILLRHYILSLAYVYITAVVKHL